MTHGSTLAPQLKRRQFLLRPLLNAVVAMGPTQKPKLYLDSSCPLAKTVLLLAKPGRAITFIVADFYFGDNVVKRGKLNIRSVKSVECSALHEELKVILQQHENSMIATSPAPVAQAAT
jgi:hypothetical protein